MFEQYNFTVEDLFQRAADGNLTVYFREPPNFNVAGLLSIKKAATKLVFSTVSNSVNVSNEEIESVIPALKDLKTYDEFVDWMSRFVNRLFNDYQAFITDIEAISPAINNAKTSDEVIELISKTIKRIKDLEAVIPKFKRVKTQDGFIKLMGMTIKQFTDIEALLPELKDAKNPGEFIDLIGRLIKRFTDPDSFVSNIQELDEKLCISVLSVYKNKGKYSIVYNIPIQSPCPLSSFNVFCCRKGWYNFPIMPKATEIFFSQESTDQEFFVLPNRVVTIQEAIDTNKLFVMKKELLKLLPKNTRYPADAKTYQNGEQNKLVPLLPEISINEIIEEQGGKLEELFYWAAIGKLNIYFQSPPFWKAEALISAKSVWLQAALGIKKEISREEIETVYPEVKNVKNIDEYWDVINKAAKRITELSTSGIDPEDFNDQEVYYLPPITRYPNNDKYHAIYVSPIESPCRISPYTFFNYLKGEGLDAIIAPKLNYGINFLDDPKEEFFIAPDTQVTIQVALEENKLFVKRAELDALNGKISDGKLSEIVPHTSETDKLTIAIHARQAAAAEYEKTKALKPSKIIDIWLLDNYPNLSSTAVEHIKFIANWELKPGPQPGTKKPLPVSAAKKAKPQSVKKPSSTK